MQDLVWRVLRLQNLATFEKIIVPCGFFLVAVRAQNFAYKFVLGREGISVMEAAIFRGE